MKWFYNLKVAPKLIMGFIVVALIAGAVGVVGISNIQTMNNLDTEMYRLHTATLDDLASLIDSYQRNRGYMKDMLINTDAEKRAEYIEKINELEELGIACLEEFGTGINSQDVQVEYDKLKAILINEFVPYKDKVVKLIQESRDSEAQEYMYSEGTRITTTVQDSINKLLELKVNLAKQTSELNSSAASSAIIIMSLVIVAGVLIAVFLGIFISGIISKPVKQMAEAADRLALGDVNVNIRSDNKDEIGSLARSFEKMIANIRGQALAAERIAAGDLTVEVGVKSENDLLGTKLFEMVRNNNEVLSNIASAAEQVAGGSKQVSDSSIVLSQGATEQASSIEELTASLEEISSQTKLNAENANQANLLADEAKSSAVQGNNQMQEMLKAMEEINESSSNISKIIKVIDDIAFQTNILALNAAVEAARAGQHGKGFAVVAEEVRNLAARSANAAKETTDMIEGSIKKVEGGTRIARDTAEALNKIVNGIQKVSSLVNGIAVASNEQATGIAQVNQGVMQVSQVVQSNSATSEESAAASEELSSQAALLKEMVGKFKLRQNGRTFNKLDELSPEVLRMLESLSEKKKNLTGANEEAHLKTKGVQSKITLSDSDFGKY